MIEDLVGTKLTAITRTATLATSRAYAEASGDHNPLHQDPQFAATASPTGEPIAHGMYAMGIASSLVTRFAGGPENVRAIDVRFTKPWPLGAQAEFGGSVAEVSDGNATIMLWGRIEGRPILKGRAVITSVRRTHRTRPQS